MLTNPYLAITKKKKTTLTAAQKAIWNAFLSLYSEMPFALISVTKLAKKAYVARSTFYTFYPNTDILLEEIEDSLIVDLLAVKGEGESKKIGKAYMENVLQYIKDNHDFLFAFLVKQPNYRFIQKAKEAVKYHLWDLTRNEAGDKNNDLSLEMIACMVIGAYTWYLKNPQELTLENLTSVVNLAIEEIQGKKE